MRKTTKILLLLIACLAVMFQASCARDKESAGGAGEKTAMGRYVERALELPEKDIKSLTAVKKSDGSLDLYLYFEQSPWYVLYNTMDGVTYEQQAMLWYSELSERQYGIADIAYDGMDNKYLLAWSGSQDGGKVYNKVYRITEDDTLEEINMEWKENSAGELKVYMTKMQVVSNGDLLFSQMGNGIVQYSSDGKFKGRYGGEQDERFTASGDNLFIIDEASSQIIVYDLNTYEQKKTVDYDNMPHDAALSPGLDGSLYLNDRSGVYRLAEGGSLWEKIIDGELTSLSIPSLYFGGIIEAKPGEYYILFADSESIQSIFKYEYDKNISTLPVTELTIYTLNENSTMRQAAGEFQRKNPDVKVNIRVGIDSDLSVTRDDAVKALNTEIIAGKGPDLILLDGMDIESYISKGVLADLSDSVKEVREGGEELIDSIAEMYKMDSKIFAVPAKFTVPSMWIDEEYAGSVKNLKNLAEFARSHNDRQIVSYLSYRDLFEIFSFSCWPAWFDTDGNLDEKNMTEFLTCIKEIYDSGRKFIDDDAIDSESRAGGTDARTQAVADSMDISDNIFNWAFGRSYTYCANMKSYNSVNSPYLAIVKRKGGAAVSLPGQSGNVFIPINVIGINAKTEKIDVAREFVRIMLSSAVQNAKTFDGFPVNIKSLEYGAEGKGNEDLYLGISGDKPDEELEGPLPSAEELKRIKNLCLTLNTPSVPDYTILEMIIDETREYFEGDEDVEKAVSRIVERTRIYLAE